MTCASGFHCCCCLAGWFGSGVVVLNSCSATMCELRVFLWCIGLVELHRPPTASPVELGTGVLWVSTGTHPCGPSPRQGGEGTRAPALHTLNDVLRLRGDEDYRAVLLHTVSEIQIREREDGINNDTSPVQVSASVDDRSGQPDETTIERGNPCGSEIAEWLQEFRENLVDDEIPVHGDSHASSSHEASLEPTLKRREDLGKHSVYTHFP